MKKYYVGAAVITIPLVSMYYFSKNTLVETATPPSQITVSKNQADVGQRSTASLPATAADQVSRTKIEIPDNLKLFYSRVPMEPGEQNVQDFDKARDELKVTRKESTHELISIYKSLNESEYEERMTTVYLLKDLAHEDALPLFKEILKTPLPPEKFANSHYQSSKSKEVTLRAMSVDGIAKIAVDNPGLKDLNYDETILGILKSSPDRLVTLHATKAYLEVHADEPQQALKTLKETMPKSEQYILGLKTATQNDIVLHKADEIMITKTESGEIEVPAP